MGAWMIRQGIQVMSKDSMEIVYRLGNIVTPSEGPPEEWGTKICLHYDAKKKCKYAWNLQKGLPSGQSLL